MKHKKYDMTFKTEVIGYAQSHSIKGALKKFRIDRKVIRDWINKKDAIVPKASGSDKGRFRLDGGGSKIKSEEMEAYLIDYIHGLRSENLRVTRKMIQEKALEIFNEVKNDGDSFSASDGWLQRFMKRHELTQCRFTTTAQQDPEDLNQKIASFVAYVSALQKKFNFAENSIIAMDETGLTFDPVSGTTVEKVGSKTVALKTTGHEKNHFTVVLAAKGDGTKLPPFIVFKGAIREVRAMQGITGAIIASSSNGWMNQSLTTEWMDKVLTRLAFSTRLLVWDAYRCHISQESQHHLKNFNCKAAVIPGGCTKYIQAPDLFYNKSFKLHVKKSYDKWMIESDKEYTSGGRMKPPSKTVVVEWVIQAWNSLPRELIRDSFKKCALCIHPDGQDDRLISCISDDGPCRGAWNILQNYRSSVLEIERQVVTEDLEQLDENEIVIDD